MTPKRIVLGRKHVAVYVVGMARAERIVPGKWVAYWRYSGAGWIAQGNGSFRTPEAAIAAARVCIARGAP